jgi:PKD repeat protein
MYINVLKLLILFIIIQPLSGSITLNDIVTETQTTSPITQPSINFTIVNYAMVNEPVNFTPDFYSKLYTWDFGDNTIMNSKYPISHQYSKSGLYIVTLTSNNETITKVIDVGEQTNQIFPQLVTTPWINNHEVDEL